MNKNIWRKLQSMIQKDGLYLHNLTSLETKIIK